MPREKHTSFKLLNRKEQTMTFPSSPTNGQTTQKFGKKFAFNSTSGAWRPVSSPVVATVREPVATPAVVSSASGLPMTGNTVGKTAYVSETNRLYIWNGSGWFEMALINTNPTITTGGDATYALNSDGTPTIITLVANDPEGVPLTWSYAVTSGALEDTTVTNVDNVFTITPGTIVATFDLSFTASDGINIDTAPSSFTLVFEPDWTASTLSHTLLAPDQIEFSRYGGAVAVTSNYVIVSGDQARQGKVHIYDASTRALVYTLDNPYTSDVNGNSSFGSSLDISGDYLIVGSYGNDYLATDAGRVYIYNITTGSLIHTINDVNGYSTPAGDWFGWSVAISGNYAIVGAPREDHDPASNQGKVYIFDVTTGGLLNTLNNPTEDQRFGDAVAVDGDYVIIGSPYTNHVSGTGSGKVYIYNVTTGALVHTLDNPNAYGTRVDDRFGQTVAISGNNVVVGAQNEDDAGGGGSGKAYIYNVSTGALVHTLDNPNLSSNSSQTNFFGQAIAISGNYVIIGASGEAGNGYVYIFDLATGNVLASIPAPYYETVGTKQADQFGVAVSMLDNIIVVGARNGNGGPNNNSAGIGRAYIFQAG
jgi:hypothetical protein